MINIYDFLYYCCYCAILRGKKNGTGEERASFMLSTFTSVLLFSFYFIFAHNKHFYNPEVLFISVLLLTIINVYFTSYVFVKTGRFKKVIAKYQTNRNKLFFGLLAWVLFIGSFTLFIYSGITAGNMVNK